MPDNATSDRNACQWNAAQEATLVCALKKAKEDGLQAENGWKPQSYANIVQALAGSELDSGGLPKGLAQVKSRYQRLKSEYQLVKKLRGLSGFGWDADHQVVTATADVWDVYLKANPRASPWHKKSFPLYDDTALLVDGLIPDGRSAFRPGRDTASTSASTDTNTNTNAMDDEAGGEGFHDASDDMFEVIDPVLRAHDKAINEIPQLPKHKPSPDPDTNSPVKKRGCQSGATAIFALSESIESAVTTLNSSSDGSSSQIPQTSLQRKTAAIRAIEKDKELLDTEMVEVADMIRERTDIADAYLALTKKTTRTAFLQKALDKHMYA